MSILIIKIRKMTFIFCSIMNHSNFIFYTISFVHIITMMNEFSMKCILMINNEKLKKNFRSKQWYFRYLSQSIKSCSFNIMMISRFDLFIWLSKIWIEKFVNFRFNRVVFYSISSWLWTARSIKSSYDMKSCQLCWNVNIWQCKLNNEILCCRF
jgi:hypothetical protein